MTNNIHQQPPLAALRRRQLRNLWKGDATGLVFPTIQFPRRDTAVLKSTKIPVENGILYVILKLPFCLLIYEVANLVL